MSKLNYLNVGCGNKFHKEWINVDMVSNSPHVKAYNLLKGIPLSNDQFDVIYHSQVLEHFPKEKAPDFIRECFRILKPGGIMRIVVPNLENIVNEYINHLNENINNPSKQVEANYDWILLEMYDQTVRNYSGGQMAEFLQQPDLVNEKYIVDRIGYVAKSIRNNFLAKKDSKQGISNLIRVAKRAGIKKVSRYIVKKITNIFTSEAQEIGSFRLGGEIHMWMYDRFSLSRLLRKVGFEDIGVKTPHESDIPNWEKYELDVKDDGAVFDPTSLFMEARKPR
jgi:predicted SAM-dependent methyltransferase